MCDGGKGVVRGVRRTDRGGMKSMFRPKLKLLYYRAICKMYIRQKYTKYDILFFGKTLIDFIFSIAFSL